MQVNFKQTVEEIVAKHHALLRRELPRISELLDGLAESLPDPEPLSEARQIYKKVRSKIETHLKDEETILFPTGIALESGAEAPHTEMDMRARLDEMEKEHDNCGNALGLITKMVEKIEQNEQSQKLLRTLGLVQEDLRIHVEKENTKVHPRFIELLNLL